VREAEEVEFERLVLAAVRELVGRTTGRRTTRPIPICRTGGGAGRVGANEEVAEVQGFL